MKKLLLIGALLASFFGAGQSAKAQSTCPAIVYGAVLTAGQWNNCFQNKQDYLGFTPLNQSSLVATAPITISPAGGVITIACPTCATVPGGPTTIGDIAIFSSTSGAVGDAGGGIPTYPVIHPSSGNLTGAGCNPAQKHSAWWVDQNMCAYGDTWNWTSTDPSAIFTATVGGSVTTGDRVRLTFTFGSGVCAAGCNADYIAQAGDTLTNVAQGLVCAIAQNANLFNLNGSTCTNGNVLNTLTGTGGYAGGKIVGYLPQPGNGTFNFDFDSTVPLRLVASVNGAATETVTIENTGCGSACSIAWDNNPALLMSRFVSGMAPPSGSQIFAIYANSNDSSSLTSLNRAYGTFSNSVLNSTLGSLSSRWALVTPDVNGSLNQGLYIGAGAYTVGVNDRGIDTLNTKVYWTNGAYSFGQSANQFQFNTLATGHPFVFAVSGTAAMGVNVSPTGTLDVGGSITSLGQNMPTTGSGAALSGTTTPSLFALTFNTGTYLPFSFGALSWDFKPSNSTAAGWTIAANVMKPDADNATTLGTATLAPSVIYTHSVAIRDTSAAFDVTLAATSSGALSAGRTLTLNMGNVAHTLAFGTTANTITFPNLASYTVITNGDTGSVTNAMLANSSVTYGTTTVALGASNTAIAGLTSIGLTTGSTINWNSDAFVGRGAAGNIKYGAADAASPVAQTISVQNVVAGTSNTAGANLTIAGSQGTGTGNGGSILLQTARAATTGTAQNALTTAMTIDGSVGLVGINSAPINDSRLLIEDGTGLNQLRVRYTGKSGFIVNQQSNANINFGLADAANMLIFVNNGTGAVMELYSSGAVSVGTSPVNTGANTLYVQNHILAGSTSPTVSSCGTSPGTPSGSDNFGSVVAGSGVLASCVINFGTAWGTAPKCVASSNTAVASMTVTATTTQLTIGGTSLTGDALTWVCGSVSWNVDEPANDNVNPGVYSRTG